MTSYIRKLRPAEYKRHFIHVDVSGSKMFPPKKIPFTLIVGNEEFMVERDNGSRIWSGKFSHKVKFHENAVFEISLDKTNKKYHLKQIE